MVHPLLYTAALGEVETEPVLDAADDAAFFPEPCIACGRPASPFVETESGPLCFTCCDTPGAPPPAVAAVRRLRLLHTAWRIACARASRQVAGVA